MGKVQRKKYTLLICIILHYTFVVMENAQGISHQGVHQGTIVDLDYVDLPLTPRLYLFIIIVLLSHPWSSTLALNET